MAVVPDMDRTDSCCRTCSNSDQTAIEMNLNNINFMAELGYVHGSDMLVGLMVEDDFSPLGIQRPVPSVIRQKPKSVQ